MKGLPLILWPKAVFGFLSSSFSDPCRSLCSGLACFAFPGLKKNTSPGAREGNISIFLNTPQYFIFRISEFSLTMFTVETGLLSSKMVSPFGAVAKPSRGALFKYYKGT